MGEQYNSYLVYTLFRLPVIVQFRLSGADAERLKRLLDRFGRGYLVKGNNARFRHMLKEVDSKLLSPFDSQELHDAYELNEEHSNAKKIQYNQWLKERARAIVFLFSFSFIISVIGARAITIGTFFSHYSACSTTTEYYFYVLINLILNVWVLGWLVGIKI